MHISHDVWQCQLGRTGQLISLINFSIKTVKSFIKDLYTVCQNSVWSQRRATYSEWTYGSAEHEKFFVSLELKVDEKISQVKWETVHPFFAKGVAKMTRTCAECYDFVKTWKSFSKHCSLEETIIVLGLQDRGLWRSSDDVTIGMSRSDGHYRQ